MILNESFASQSTMLREMCSTSKKRCVLECGKCLHKFCLDDCLDKTIAILTLPLFRPPELSHLNWHGCYSGWLLIAGNIFMAVDSGLNYHNWIRWKTPTLLNESGVTHVVEFWLIECRVCVNSAGWEIWLLAHFVVWSLFAGVLDCGGGDDEAKIWLFSFQLRFWDDFSVKATVWVVIFFRNFALGLGQR